MIGHIYNNPQLAYEDEDDGYWTFLGDHQPHKYWCVLHVQERDVLLAPIFFDVMDNLPNPIIDTCPVQISEGIQNITIGIGRCIIRSQEEITTDPVIYLNPDKAKWAYNIFARNS